MFKLFKNKEKSQKNNVLTNSDFNEKTREKFILKGWIELSIKPTCTKKPTRGFLFGAQTHFKMDFSAGRSMVEMLGVLAIIGVLSISGIQGYTIAMRHYQANEILNIANKYAVTIWTQYQQKIINEPEKYYWMASGYGQRIYYDMTEELAKEIGEEISDMISLSHYDRTYYEGDKPSALSELSFEGIWAGKSGIGVALYFTFESQALCETVKSMTDADEMMYYNCGESKESLGEDAKKKLSLYFYQQ